MMKVFKRMPLNGGIRYIISIFLLVAVISQCVYYKHEYKKLEVVNCALNNTIKEQLVKMESLNSELKSCVSELEEKNKMIENMSKAQPAKKDFKSYMPYTSITDESSYQYKLQQQATTDADGIRCINSRPLVAIGTGWGVKVGDIVLITCDNGNSFEAVVGDIKADTHTRSDNKTTMSNGCRCEFIVEMGQLNKDVKLMGNVSVLEKYTGYVVSIEKLN